MVLESERLYLEEFTINDASFFYKLVNDPDWIKYIGDRNKIQNTEFCCKCAYKLLF